MTGPEHYRKAEDLARSADVAIGRYEEHGWESKRDIAAVLMSEAQVHAVLALTAAYAADAIYRRDDRAAWDAATGHATTEQEISR